MVDVIVVGGGGGVYDYDNILRKPSERANSVLRIHAKVDEFVVMLANYLSSSLL